MRSEGLGRVDGGAAPQAEQSEHRGHGARRAANETDARGERAARRQKAAAPDAVAAALARAKAKATAAKTVESETSDSESTHTDSREDGA